MQRTKTNDVPHLGYTQAMDGRKVAKTDAKASKNSVKFVYVPMKRDGAEKM